MILLESNLSAGRKWGRLGDFYAVTRKPRGLSLRGQADVVFVPMEAIPQGGKLEPNYTQKSSHAIASGTYFERGDILIAKITPSFENGKQALVNNIPSAFGYATTEVIPVHAKESNQDARFLFYYLLHPDIRNFIATKMEGATGRQRVPEDVLLDLPLPIIPKKEQSDISNVLFFIRKHSESEQRSEQLTQELKRAVMRIFFTQGLRGETQKETDIGLMPMSWAPRTILELCEIWSGGTPRKSVSKYWGGNIPWVSGKDLKSPALDDAIDHITREGAQAGSRIAPEGAVLILVRGMGLAKDLPVAVIKRPMAFNQDVKALVSRGEFSGSFLRSAIYVGKDRLLSQIVPSAHGTMTLNLNDIETFKIPCPTDHTEARDIVTVLDTIDRKIALHRKKYFTLEELFKSLLNKLVTGEIRISDLNLSALTTKVSTMELQYEHPQHY